MKNNDYLIFNFNFQLFLHQNFIYIKDIISCIFKLFKRLSYISIHLSTINYENRKNVFYYNIE